MMKQRKSNRNSKFARMSEEERARYMQHRAEFELEAKRRKQQLIATYIKNKLKHENVFSKLNTAKINETWRLVLRQIKCKEIYENVKDLSESFDRVVNLKDKTICQLQSELKVADEDHRKLQEAHIELMNDIIGKYKHKLQDLHDLFKLDNNKSSALELAFLKIKMKQVYKEMQSTVVKKTEKLKEEKFTAKTRNAINIRNILILEEDVMSNLIHISSQNLKNLWEQLNRTLIEYERVTKNKKKQYEYLKEQDSVYQQCILQYPKVQLQLQNAAENLRCNIQILSLKRDEQVGNLKMKNAHIKKETRDMKQYFSTVQAVDYVQLKKLTVFSNDALKNLQKTMQKCSTILELITICSNLEPFHVNFRNYFIEGEIPSSHDKIEKFWQKYNDVAATNILLRKECKKLSLENKRLKYELQAHVIRISGVPEIRMNTSTSI
ncbi:dynein regulatory complex subunit 2 [Lasioglossum baleicum]|uniref:dynein regulatory complex subunit 2 n=1 Tax=Lasioglossum baleicum TaxID=434251 RepID=UPI003FCDFB22